jgi:hypothetical protein
MAADVMPRLHAVSGRQHRVGQQIAVLYIWLKLEVNSEAQLRGIV